MSRPSTQRRRQDGVLTDDDFLFIPPATASSSRSPRTARGSSRRGEPGTRFTVVGAGTVGLGERGCKMEAPANVHREWLRAKRSQGSGGSDSFELPSLSPREQFEQSKVHRARKTAAKADLEERLAAECAAEKKKRIEEAKKVKEELQGFTKQFAAEAIDRDRNAREFAKRTREEELKLYEKWCRSMTGITRIRDPSEASERRHQAIVASAEARQAVEESMAPKSPQRERVKALRFLRSAAERDHQVWQTMIVDQQDVDKFVVGDKHKFVQELHVAAVDALHAEEERKRAAAAAQRAAAEEYRAKWGTEATGWRAGLVESVAADRASRQQAIAKRRELLANDAEEEGNAARTQLQELKQKREKQKDFDIELNKQRALVVRESIAAAKAARAALRNEKSIGCKEAKMESERRKAMKDADRDQDRTARKAMHDEELSRTRSRSPKEAEKSQPVKLSPVPPATAPSTARR